MKSKTVVSLTVIALFLATFGASDAKAMGRGREMSDHPRFSQMKQKMWARNARKGKILAISAEKLTLQGIHRPITVDIAIDSETKYLNKGNDPITLSDIKVGEEVQVKGVRWDKDSKVFGPARIVRKVE